jgi:hypothetical protein
MHAQKIAINRVLLATLGTGASMLAGCNTVSMKEVLSTSYGAGRELAPEAMASTGDVADAQGAGPRFVVVQTAEQSLPVGMTSASATSGMVASGGQALTAYQQRFLSSTNNQIAAMNARLMELRAQAGIKGVAAEAAMRRHVRDYDMALKMIDDQMIGSRTLDAVGWADLQATTAQSLLDARIALENAIDAVESLPNTRS